VKKVIALVVALVVLGAAPAVAHVTVTPGEVAAGSYVKLTFRVPNESPTERTVEIEVVFPEAATFRSVAVKPAPGWDHTVTRNGDVVTAVSWAGGEIGPDEFMEFDLSVGPVPEVDVLELKTLQTYSDGEVVRWIDPVVDGEDAPSHPAPRLVVTAGGGEAGGHGIDDGAAADGGSDGTETATFLALFLAGAALMTAVAALVMGRRALRR